MGEIAHRQAGDARTALERMQIALQLRDVLAQLRLGMPLRQHASA